MTSPKTRSITFRLSDKVLEALRKEADQNDISVNTLAAQILKHHIEWHSNAAKAGFVTVRRAFLTYLMDKASEEEISTKSRALARIELKEFVLLLRNEYNIGSALSVVESWVRTAGYAFRHENSDTVHSYVIQHDMGRRMSQYLLGLYDSLFKEFGLEKVRLDMTENSVSFVVDIR